jgi:hypothetical protein
VGKYEKTPLGAAFVPADLFEIFGMFRFLYQLVENFSGLSKV